MPDTIQLALKCSGGGGTDGTLHDGLAFNRWNDDKRNVNVNRNNNDWNDNWWFGGVRNFLHFPALSQCEKSAGFCFVS